MKIIKIFIASSIKEFKKERMELGDFVRRLNDICLEKEIYLELFLCEDLSNAVAKDRKQEEYNQLIRQCDLFYILLGRQVGQYTMEEFELARQQYKTTGQPVICIWFQTLPEGGELDESICSFKEHLKDNQESYCDFVHIDSVKLDILMNLTREIGELCELNFRDGKALLDGETVLKLNHVPFYKVIK